MGEKLVARVYERVSNVRQDFLHNLSRRIVNDNQVVVVENLNIKGCCALLPAVPRGQVTQRVRNHKLTKAISDTGWGIFTNFLAYKVEKEGKVLVEINRWFPSSKTCLTCNYQIAELPLDVRAWTCPCCHTHHDRDENAAKNIRAEGIRMLKSPGKGDSASRGDVRPNRGRKSKTRQLPVKLEAQPSGYCLKAG